MNTDLHAVALAGWFLRGPARSLMLCFAFFLPLLAEASGLAVLYPEVRAPYTRVFDDIVAGIKTTYRQDVEVFVLAKSGRTDDLADWLRQKQIVNIVALGNQAMKLALELPAPPFLTVAGAVLSAPELDESVFSAITMAPDPDLLFDQLRALSPEIQTVSVVYRFGRHDALIKRADALAASYGLVISAHGTDNAREGANLFKSIIDDHAPGKTAIWLLQDVPALKERSVLQSLLRRAWDHKILVFSSNPSYVKKGALFSLFPNNVALGSSLAKASMALEKGSGFGSRPSRELDSVLNTRTAEHLGLRLSRSRRRQFDILFPSE